MGLGVTWAVGLGCGVTPDGRGGVAVDVAVADLAAVGVAVGAAGAQAATKRARTAAAAIPLGLIAVPPAECLSLHLRSRGNPMAALSNL